MLDDISIEEIMRLGFVPDVVEELNDPRFLTRKHGSGATAALGCHGPLCRKHERDKQRRRNQRRAEAAGREYRPYTQLWDRDELLDAIMVWHEHYLVLGRLEARSQARQEAESA